MTYEEFKEIIEESGKYEVIKNCGYVFVKNLCETGNMCCINAETEFAINTQTDNYNSDFIKEYGATIIEFAKTPIKDRYPVKKYYVKFDLLEFIYKQNCYLNKVTDDEYPEINYTLNNRVQVDNHQTQFTMEEIEEIIPKEDMDKFKFIPVEEDK